MTGLTATLACQRGNKPKREDCPCDPCKARREIFGANVPVQVQEPRRTNLAAGRLISLKDGSLDDEHA